jgi:hypothetical protein
MLECLILGDSLAVGIASAKHGCEVHAKVGITTSGFNAKHLKNYSSKLTVISLGSNDYLNLRPTYANLEKLRKHIEGRVIWVLPRNSDGAREIVAKVAAEHGDTTIDARKVPGDHLHPTGKGYQQLALQAK